MNPLNSANIDDGAADFFAALDNSSAKGSNNGTIGNPMGNHPTGNSVYHSSGNIPQPHRPSTSPPTTSSTSLSSMNPSHASYLRYANAKSSSNQHSHHHQQQQQHHHHPHSSSSSSRNALPSSLYPSVHPASHTGRTTASPEFSNRRRVPSQKEKEKEISIQEKIVQLLVPDMSLPELLTLIKKMKAAGKSEYDEFSEQPTVATKLVPRFTCDICGNIDQNHFITDYARGDTICTGKDGTGCGNVVQDRIVHEGSAYRKFEGEEDKSHHGPAPNNLFSIGHNLRTLISNDGDVASVLRRASDFVEMNLSQMGKDERRTRIGYKDQMKQKACRLIDHAASNLELHEIVVARAKEMFAEFRDLREHVHQFEAVVAGCILAAYIEIGKEMAYSLSCTSTTHSSATATRSAYGPSTTSSMPLSRTNDDLSIARDRLGYIHPPVWNSSRSFEITEKQLYPFTCKVCQRNFNAKRALQFHQCQLEDSVEKKEKKQKEEQQEKEKKEEKEAQQNTQRKEEIQEEEIQYTTERRGKEQRVWYLCKGCDRSYLKEEAIIDHIKRHQNQKRKRVHSEKSSTMDQTRIPKENMLVSTNPSVQIGKRDNVLFRGLGRRPWLMSIQEEAEKEKKEKQKEKENQSTRKNGEERKEGDEQRGERDKDKERRMQDLNKG